MFFRFSAFGSFFSGLKIFVKVRQKLVKFQQESRRKLKDIGDVFLGNCEKSLHVNVVTNFCYFSGQRGSKGWNSKDACKADRSRQKFSK